MSYNTNICSIPFGVDKGNGMASRKRNKTTSKRKQQARAAFEIGQRVLIDGYGAGTVIAVEARRGGRYSDIWVRPDENPEQEIGAPYQRQLIEPA
jgi:hypothetical protein